MSTLFSKDPNKFKNGSLNTLNYKHPKYCYYVNDQENVYKVLGYHYTIQKYRLQSTADHTKFITCEAHEIAGIFDRNYLEHLKKLYG